MSYSNPAAYEQFMGRWSARLAPSFLRFADVRDGQHVLDVGCGTGSLTRALLSCGAMVNVTGIDPVPAYVSFAQKAVQHPRAQFTAGAVEWLPYTDRAFDAALGLLVLQDFGEPLRAIREMARVTREGGVVATCVWDFQDGMPMLSVLWDAAERVAPNAVWRRRAENPHPRRPTAHDLQALWRSCGLFDIEVVTLELSMEFSSFDDYWQPFLGGSTPTSAFATAVNTESGGELARVVRDRLTGSQPNACFALPARAWAIKGTVGSQRT